jgi:chitin disaccharide deacetylase
MAVSPRLILNADDFGLSRGISDGILVAHREGLLTSTSLLVNQPATDYAVSKLATAPRLGCGIHLNLCQGAPVLAARMVPTLVTSSGEFHSPPEMSRRLLRWQVSGEEIEAEFRAQIARMRTYGLRPTHADSHHRLHMYPAAVGPFRRAVFQEGILRARSPRKRYWPTNGRLGGPHTGTFFRRVAAKAYLEFLHSFVFYDLLLPDAGVTFDPQHGRKLDRLSEEWRSALEHMPAGTYEMWCHPGFWDKEFSPTDKLAQRREREIGILTDAKLREVVNRRQIELITFDQVGGSNPCTLPTQTQ